MSNGRTHKIIGTGAGAIAAVAANHYYFHDSENAWLYAIAGGVGGLACSRIPDILEPAEELGPNHRGFCHGIVCNGAAAVVLPRVLWQKVNQLVEKAKVFDRDGEKLKAALCRFLAGAIIGGAAGYASHLLADSSTTKSLPFFD